MKFRVTILQAKTPQTNVHLLLKGVVCVAGALQRDVGEAVAGAGPIHLQVGQVIAAVVSTTFLQRRKQASKYFLILILKEQGWVGVV
jgi:hypothetical protein